MTSNELIDISVDIGAALLENGAEIYRVEESIARICYAYGATETNIYAVPTAIIASFVRGNSHPVTRVLRIYRRGTNLGRLDQLNTLCREICATSMTYAQIQERLVYILHDKPFHRYHLCLATGGIGFFFTRLDSRSNMQSVYLYYPLGHYDIFAGTARQSAVYQHHRRHLGRGLCGHLLEAACD